MRICVISKGRPLNVPKMKSLAGGAGLIWYVPPSEARAYAEAGADRVVAAPQQEWNVPNPKAATMSAALDDGDFTGDPVLLLDDDLQSLKWLREDGTVEGISINDAARFMLATSLRYGATLTGVLPYYNPYFAKPRTRQGFLKMAAMLLVSPGNLHRFDYTLPSGEDYEFIARVFSNGGWVARHDDVIPKFKVNDATSHYGSGSLRQEANNRTNRLLLARYPGMFKPTVRDGLVDDLRFMINGRNGQ